MTTELGAAPPQNNEQQSDRWGHLSVHGECELPEVGH
eukprot:SAG31_NODE_42421_length_271_cov_1.523256_1_plen_36_part_01